jgi:hypothetical protein
VQAARSAKRSTPPEAPLTTQAQFDFAEMRIQVGNETPLQATRRLSDRGLRPVALNFANGFRGALETEQAGAAGHALAAGEFNETEDVAGRCVRGTFLFHRRNNARRQQVPAAQLCPNLPA